MAASVRDGGDVIVGDIDVKAEVDGMIRIIFK